MLVDARAVRPGHSLSAFQVLKSTLFLLDKGKPSSSFFIAFFNPIFLNALF